MASTSDSISGATYFDPSLTDLLSDFPESNFDGEVYRVTGISIDPLAYSTNGGRWAPEVVGAASVQVLYTSCQRDGAISEVVSYLTLLTPPPTKSLKISKLRVKARRVLTLTKADFKALGIDETRYGERRYQRTQEIGAAVNFIGLDGLLAPSARWSCDNLMIFGSNHNMDDTLELVETEELDWQEWAEINNFDAFLR